VRILVAEDHPTLSQSIARGLRDEGFVVDLSHDGSEAEYLTRTASYDCAILDIMLPGMEGWEVLQKMRAGNLQTPVLLLTARDAVADRVRGLDLGADDYLIKPFAFEELVARVRALVRRKHGKNSSALTIGDLEIDIAAKTIRRGKAEIQLTAKEFALLEYLAMRQGEVVSRTDIWEHLYDNEDENSSNVVDVYIGYLRNKIDKPFGTKSIQTRRGHGYVLVADSVGAGGQPG